MSEYTPNLNLEKPNENELFNINTFNSNFDKIDTALQLNDIIKKSDIVLLTQSEYDALTEKNANFYFIKEDGASS